MTPFGKPTFLFLWFSAVCFIITIHPCHAKNSEKKSTTGTAVDMLILWDTGTVKTPDAELLSAFGGSFKKTDRLAIADFNFENPMAMPLQKITPDTVQSTIYETLEKLTPPKTEQPALQAIESSLTYLSKQKRPNTLSSLIIITQKKINPTSDKDSPDAGTDAPLSPLLSKIVLDEIIVDVITTDPLIQPQYAELVKTSGGKSIITNGPADIITSLWLLYDSLQLRAIELSTQPTQETAQPVDYRYLDEKVATIDEAVQQDRDSKQIQNVQNLKPDYFIYVALLLLALTSAAALTIGLLILKRMPALNLEKQKSETQKKSSSPSFSKLTMGFNNFRKSLRDTERKLETLSLDLEDFGAESWELEKKLMDEYVALTSKLFLLLDHLELKKESDNKAKLDEAWCKERIQCILQDTDIESFSPQTGDLFDSKQHMVLDERPDTSKPGTILETVRRGYIKTQGLTSKQDFVLRQAEVIVSLGPSRTPFETTEN